MAVVEIGDPQFYSAAFTTVSGAFAPVATTNFDGSCKVVSIQRLGAPGGTAGVPAAAVEAPSGAGASATWKLGVYSSVSGDTSTYNVSWARFYQPSPGLAQGVTASGPVTAAAGQQYAP